MDTRTKEKLIKDTVHEYIYIDERYFSIIDSALFQRLKNVKQTSYISLYPSSTHDRFTHSLGTYHLGSRVIHELWNNISNIDELNVLNKKKGSIIFTFEMACLLHDVGHAPFSHTGENFFAVRKIDDTIPIYKILKKYEQEHRVQFSYIDGLLINVIAQFYKTNLEKPNTKSPNYKTVETFIKDYIGVVREKSAKPHEKISAIISLKYLSDEIKKIAGDMKGTEESPKIEFNADLFVRCIIGAIYKESRSVKKEDKIRLSFDNTVISLLNSNTIDVDKLDYILRDTYMTGYKNTGIDVERLINSFTVVVEDGQWCRRAYKKNAFSVIENVIMANDSSRRWVQNHPIILYDAYLTQKCIGEAFKILREKTGKNLFETFFSVESLTKEGIDWIDDERIYLLSDIDAIAAIKKAENIAQKEGKKKSLDIFDEYFSRRERRHPLWKSEMEFRVCFNMKKMNENEKKRMREIKDAVNAIISQKKDETTNIGEYIIDEDLCDNVLNKNEDYPTAGKCLLKNIKNYFKKIKKNVDLVILQQEGFESKLKKLDGDNVYVEMPDYGLDRWNCTTLYRYSDLVFIPKNDNKIEDVFYFYSKERINTKDFVTFLLTEAVFDE